MKTTLEALATTTGTAAAAPGATAERLQVLALVEQFEGMLLTEMLRDVRAGDEDDGGFGLGSSTMTDLMQGEFGLALSRGGGLGLGEMLASALVKRGASVPAAIGALDAAADATLSGSVESVSALVPGAGGRVRDGGMTPPAHTHQHDRETVGDADDAVALVSGGVPVTSAFGWRSDPFTGHLRFHRGVDLAMAYGSEVRAFGPGVVSSAGERPGYGLTVVIDHGQGKETLYGHLSAIDVTPGQAVEGGQRLARSGQSGRATGAHLHFEAREFGRAVEAGRLAGVIHGRLADTSVGNSDAGGDRD
jgi:murein DD-endopeptidase MepM/ murein hydrolase activator NlpD